MPDKLFSTLYRLLESFLRQKCLFSILRAHSLSMHVVLSFSVQKLT